MFAGPGTNKIKGTPILKLAMVKRLKVNKNSSEKSELENILSKNSKFVEKIRRKFF